MYFLQSRAAHSAYCIRTDCRIYICHGCFKIVSTENCVSGSMKKDLIQSKFNYSNTVCYDISFESVNLIMWVPFLHFPWCRHSENQIPAAQDMIQSDAYFNLLHVISSVQKKGWGNNSLKHKSIMFMLGLIVMSLCLIWLCCIGEL